MYRSNSKVRETFGFQNDCGKIVFATAWQSWSSPATRAWSNEALSLESSSTTPSSKPVIETHTGANSEALPRESSGWIARAQAWERLLSSMNTLVMVPPQETGTEPAQRNQQKPRAMRSFDRSCEAS